MAGRQWLAVLAAALIGGGAATLVASCGEDDGDVQIEGGTTGTHRHRHHRHGHGHGRPWTPTPPSAAGLEQAMSQGHGLRARRRPPSWWPRPMALQKAIDAGSVAAAKKAYAAGRPYYERIEPLVALFPELDGKIDAREDDFPKKAEDPTWTGFHPIERDALEGRADHAAHQRAGRRPGRATPSASTS